MTFIDEILNGTQKETDLPGWVYNWSKSDKIIPLRKCLGFTPKEYALLFQNPFSGMILNIIVNGRKLNKK